MGLEFNPFSLQDRVILVTGASSGIGRTTAIMCSKMGAKVIITGRNETRLQETYHSLSGEGHVQIAADLSNPTDIEGLLKSVEKLDGVVLCAGRGLSLPVLYSTREKFNEVFDINFFSPVELLRLLVRKKKLSFDSSVVFIISIGGTTKWTPGNAVYGSSKAALKSMAQYFALELASKRIRVNGICPGMVETPLIHQGTVSEEQMAEDRERYPLKRYGRPEDISYGAIYLLSDASSWLTGQSLVIDGGISIR